MNTNAIKLLVILLALVVITSNAQDTSAAIWARPSESPV